MSCAFNQRLVYLTSLLEVSIADLSSNKVRTIAIDSEPGFLGLGEAHVAAGMNNQAWFYRIGPPSEAGWWSIVHAFSHARAHTCFKALTHLYLFNISLSRVKTACIRFHF